jgi:hypothetical protein
MSVTNRKMFRPRNARNRLNQLGGIMASSPELMDTVARFNQGGSVPDRIRIQALADVLGRGFTTPGGTGGAPVSQGPTSQAQRDPTRPVPSNRSLVPYNPGFTTPGGTGGAPVSQGPTSQAQRDPTRPVPSNRSLVPVQPPQQPQQPRSTMQGIQQLLTPTARFFSRTPILSAIYGGGRAIADPLNVGSIDPFEPRSVMGIDPTKRRDREFFLEDFDRMSEEQQQMALDAANEARGASRALATAGRVAGTIADPLLELGQDVLNMDVTERRLETAAAEAQQRNRPLTMEEYRLSLLSQDPERNVRILNDRRERVGPTAAPPPSTGGTPQDVAQTKAISDQIFGGALNPIVEKKTSGKTTKKDALADIPPPPDQNIINSDAETATDYGARIAATAAKFLNSNADEIEKNELLLELAGRKDPEKKMTLKEQYKENVELYQEVFGSNPEKDKKIDGYNIAMLGFMIAAGDSPNALQNIARGVMNGVDRIQKTAEARQAREEKIKFAALQRASSQQDAQIERETQWAKTLFTDARDQSRFRNQLAFDLAKLNIELEEKRDLANDKAVSDQTRADANNEATLLRTMINNYGPLGNLAATQLMTQGFDPKKIFTPEGFKELTNTMEDLAKRFPDLLRTSQKSVNPGDSRSAYIQKGLDAIRRSPDAEAGLRELLKLGKKEILTAEMIIKQLGKEFDLAAAAAPAPPPPPPPAPHRQHRQHRQHLQHLCLI